MMETVIIQKPDDDDIRNDSVFGLEKTLFPMCKRTLVYDRNSTLPQVFNFCNFVICNF